jgi:FAD:protein FMN transferase
MSRANSELTTAAWEALGTRVVIQVTDPGALERARTIVERELDAIDRACSRFRPDSELSRVNARAGHVVVVDTLLIEAMRVALRAAALTDGDVDPTVGAALVLAGYDRDWQLLRRAGDRNAEDEFATTTNSSSPSPEHLRPRVLASVRTGWRTVELDCERASIRVPAGVRLDLGATAKAWAADRASHAAAASTGAGVLVSLGGDISTSGAAPAGGWRIRVTDDHRSDPSAPGQSISICSGGLATSSIAVRRWSHGARTMHHIIDPSTGEPVRGRWRTVSVAGANCTDANIASTASLVRATGEEHADEDCCACAWLRELGLPARLVDHAGATRTIGGWPPDTEHERAREPCGI